MKKDLHYMSRNPDYYAAKWCHVIKHIGLLDTWITPNDIENLLEITGEEYPTPEEKEFIEPALQKTRYVDDYVIEKAPAFRTARNVNMEELHKSSVYKVTQVQDMHTNNGDFRLTDEQRHRYRHDAQLCIRGAVDEIAVMQDDVREYDRELLVELAATVDKLNALLDD